MSAELRGKLADDAKPNHRGVGAQIIFLLEGLYGLNDVARAEVLKLVGVPK